MRIMADEPSSLSQAASEPMSKSKASNKETLKGNISPNFYHMLLNHISAFTLTMTCQLGFVAVLPSLPFFVCTCCSEKY